jgi:anti-sigma factor ChrR (cupin superfamily)
MPIDRHPSQDVRAAYKAGDISPGAALALTVHAERCAVCRVDIQSLVPPGRGGRTRPLPKVATTAALPGSESHALAELRQSSWRWLTFGLRAAELYGASGLGEAVLLLELAAGCTLPVKAVRALAQLVVLQGGLRDGDEALRPGDYIDAAVQPLRRPVAERPDGCLCLVVTDGSWPGRSLAALLSGLRGRKRG